MITGINHITLSVRDIERSFQFYIEILGLTPIQKNARSCYVTAGGTWIAFDRYDGDLDRPLPDYSHIAFQVLPENFQKCVTRLQQAGCEAWQQNSTEGDSFYFLDPDGHKLEVHCTTLAERIQDGKRHWGEHVTWYC